MNRKEARKNRLSNERHLYLPILIPSPIPSPLSSLNFISTQRVADFKLDPSISRIKTLGSAFIGRCPKTEQNTKIIIGLYILTVTGGIGSVTQKHDE